MLSCGWDSTGSKLIFSGRNNPYLLARPKVLMKSKEQSSRQLKTISPSLSLWTAAWCLLFGMSLLACGPLKAPGHQEATPAKGMVILTIEDHEKELAVRLGDTIQIELERAGSTGYDWHIDGTYKEYFNLLYMEDKQKAAEHGLLGGPMIKTWRLQTIQRGKIELVIRLYRDWESRNNAVGTFSIKATIE
jgi:predicted secreted protein